jgi:anti-sigma-K factor RskA
MYDDDQDALAAEYVLGTLSASERDQAEALLSVDPGFAAIVRQWERRLGELNVMVEAVEPPPELWDKIKTEVGGIEQVSAERTNVDQDNEVPLLPLDLGIAAPPVAAEAEADTETDRDESSTIAALASSLLPPEEASEFKSPGEPPSPRSVPRPERKVERSADVVYLARRVSRWRSLTIGLGALAALLALFIAVSTFAPGLLPLNLHSSSPVTARGPGPAKPQGSRLVAALQQEPTAPAFLLTVDSQTRTLTVRRVSATPEAGRSYELWLISKRFPTPRSLGLVGNDEFTQRPLPGNFDIDTLRAASYAVSLEPAGGSPSGVPTGPVLFTGKLVDALPGATPPG